MQVFQIREEKRPHIPAVTHVDGSGLLQTVKSATNPRYHALISAVRDLTGAPMVPNTSFNENLLSASQKRHWIAFLRTNMDVLVLGDVMIVRSAAVANPEESVAASTT